MYLMPSSDFGVSMLLSGLQDKLLVEEAIQVLLCQLIHEGDIQDIDLLTLRSRFEGEECPWSIYLPRGPAGWPRTDRNPPSLLALPPEKSSISFSSQNMSTTLTIKQHKLLQCINGQ